MNKSSDNWPYVFYLFGVVSLLWYIFWLCLCYDSPKEHPFITEGEKKYLIKQLSSITHDDLPPFPWKYALTSKPFLALVIIQCGHDWLFFIVIKIYIRKMVDDKQ